jgi:MFS superfamily sulfate permease-like transporter
MKVRDRFAFSWAEFSGSLGDLGLFIPLVVAMSSVGSLDLGTILIAAGVMNVATGWFFRQPIPVQPMKAIAAVAITEGLAKGELMASGIVMGAILLALGLTGTIGAIDRWIPRPLVRGIQLGVGLKLAAKGIGWVYELPFWSWDGICIAILAALFMLWMAANRKPGLILLFCVGFVLILLGDPKAFEGIGLAFSGFHFGWPAASDWQAGLLRGAVPQLPLTVLNSVVAVCALSGDYFPGRGISPKRMAVSVGLMNLVCSPFGGIPMCHGSGGLAAQYRFGARTGGSVIMLGLVKIIVGIAFGGALLGLLGSYPNAILGPMLVFAGIELARACADAVEQPLSLSVLLVTAAAIIGSNTFIGFLAGSAFYALATGLRQKRG